MTIARWWEDAACAGTDEALWFPTKGGSGYQSASRYCHACPVRRPCLDDALTTDVPSATHGMRAGFTPIEREDIVAGRTPYPDFPTPQPTPTPAPRPAPAPKEQHPMTVTDITPDPAAQEPTVGDLIAWGSAHSSSRIQTLAGKARAALADLRQAHEREARVADAEARVARLKAQLANAEKDLSAAKGGKPKTAAGRPAEDYAAIRAWAQEQGIRVPVRGIPKREIRDAYYAACAA